MQINWSDVKVRRPPILTETVSVEAHGCEQLAQSRRTQPRPGRSSNSRPPDRTFDALPLRQHHTPPFQWSGVAHCAEAKLVRCIHFPVDGVTIGWRACAPLVGRRSFATCSRDIRFAPSGCRRNGLCAAAANVHDTRPSPRTVVPSRNHRFGSPVYLTLTFT